MRFPKAGCAACGCCWLTAESRPKLCGQRPRVMCPERVTRFVTRVDPGFVFPHPQIIPGPSLSSAPVQSSQAETGRGGWPSSCPHEGWDSPSPVHKQVRPHPIRLLLAVTLERDGPLLQIHTEPSTLCPPSPHTHILTPGHQVAYQTVHCPGGHRRSPGEPSASTGRSAPPRSAAHGGRSGCSRSIRTALRRI